MNYKGIDYYVEKSKEANSSKQNKPLTMFQKDYLNMVAMIQTTKSKELQDFLFGITEKELQERYKLI